MNFDKVQYIKQEVFKIKIFRKMMEFEQKIFLIY
jgi:hypothetical protein